MTREGEEDVLLAFATSLLGWRWRILTLGAVGATVGLAFALLSRRVYVSESTFLPEMSDANLSSLALAATQFGVRLPSMTGGGWGPPVYVELLRSRGMLEPIIRDTVVVAEEGNRRVAMLDLLRIRDDNPGRRVERGIRSLRNIISAQEEKSLNGVRVKVTTRWASVSQTIAQRLVSGVQQFNLETRQSQAGAERRFVEARAQEAEQTLRQAEDRLQVFMSRNRTITGSPELAFERDRLQRDVTLRQQLYTALLQSREEARAREVRDTPVITVVEAPQLPVLPASRRAILKAIAGGLAGGILGFTLAFLARGLARARQIPSAQVQDFFRLLDEVTPRRFRRSA